METVKSTIARRDLTKLLNKLAREEIPKIAIEVSGEAIAVLTLDEPEYEIPPIKLMAEEARNDWAGILEAVSIRNARFVFCKKDSDKRVYLRRHKSFRHAASQRWSQHINEFREQQKQPPTMDDMLEAQDALSRKFEDVIDQISQMQTTHRLLFAKIERKGDLFATSENGYQPPLDSSSLDRYEAD